MRRDIVDQLRFDGEGERQHEREARVVLGGLLDEAADEIERLRKEVAAAQDERAKIVAWLRDGVAMSDVYYINHVEAQEIAQYIEAGEHLK